VQFPKTHPRGFANKGGESETFKIMIMRMFAILDKAKPDIESIKGLKQSLDS
jgi:hypothetical protein